MSEQIEKFLHILSGQPVADLPHDSEQLFQCMLADLDSQDNKKRRVALHILAELRDPRAVPHLLGTLAITDRLIQRDAIEALGAIGDPRAVPELLDALQDRDWFIQQAAIEALGKIGDPGAIPHLVAALQDDDKWVATEAAEALGSIGHSDALVALLRVLRSERLIQSFNTSVADAKKPVNQQTIVASGTFVHEISDLRCAVALALGKICDSRAVPDMIDVLQHDPDPQVCAACAAALEQFGTSEAFAAVRDWRQASGL